MAFIVSMITEAIVADLTDVLSTDDDSGSNLVRIGRLQDDPQAYDNPILVHENDPFDLGESWGHQQYQNPGLTRSLWMGSVEIGGSELYLRRFTIELRLYLTARGLTRDQAKNIIDLVHGRCIHALRDSVRIPNLVDEFGEVALMCKNGVVKSRMRLNGGPPDDWIGDGRIWFQVITQLPGHAS
jgi:hypothetical protein